MNEWNIQSRARGCQECEAEFSDKETYHTILCDEKQGYKRLDVCLSCWDGQFSEGASDRKGFISHWKGIYESPPPAPPEPIKKEGAESLMRKLIELDDPKYIPAVYILGAMLERKRLLKVKEQIVRGDQRICIYEQPKTGDLFTVPDPRLRLDQLEAVQHDVAQLLEQGLNPPGETGGESAVEGETVAGEEGGDNEELAPGEEADVEAAEPAVGSEDASVTGVAEDTEAAEDPGDGALIEPVAELETFQERLGYTFRDPGLLRLALTHPSVSHESGGSTQHNQRLEFLGDAVLGVVLTKELYEKFPDLGEGPLTKARAQMVNRKTLARQARAVEMGRVLILSNGEEMSGGRSRESSLADAFEAVLGAVFLDGGFEAAQGVIVRCFREVLGEEAEVPNLSNPKGELQELLQAGSTEAPQYELSTVSGPDHDRLFECAVFHGGVELGRGEGKSKKAAESKAAAMALRKVRKRAEAGNAKKS